MNIKLLAIGKTDNKALQQLMDDYMKRLSFYVKFELEVIPDIKNAKNLSEAQQTMVKLTQYDDIVKDMLFYFSQRIAAAHSQGINDIIIDPGFGFAKTLQQNYEVLNKLELFKMIELPILAGMSRKSMLYKLLDITPHTPIEIHHRKDKQNITPGNPFQERKPCRQRSPLLR